RASGPQVIDDLFALAPEAVQSWAAEGLVGQFDTEQAKLDYAGLIEDNPQAFLLFDVPAAFLVKLGEPTSLLYHQVASCLESGVERLSRWLEETVDRNGDTAVQYKAKKAAGKVGDVF